MKSSLVLLCLILLLRSTSDQTSGEPVVVGHEPLTAEVGDNVTLECHLEPPFDVTTLTVEWKLNGSTPLLVHRYRSRAGYRSDQDDRYKGRTSMFHDKMSKGNISLHLTNVTLEDSGLYICFVPKLPSQVRRGNISLTVVSQGKNKTVDDKPGNDDGGDHKHLGAVIGGAVGGVGGVVLLAAGVVIYKYCNRARDHRPVAQDEL